MTGSLHSRRGPLRSASVSVTVVKAPKGARVVRYLHEEKGIARKPQAVRLIVSELLSELGAEKARERLEALLKQTGLAGPNAEPGSPDDSPAEVQHMMAGGYPAWIVEQAAATD